MNSKQLALITALFCTYMESLCHVSRGKTGEGDRGSRSKRTKNNAPLVNGQAVEENEGILLANSNQ